jgi:hypothetical protein
VTLEEITEYVRKVWDEYGACWTCGAHDILPAYLPLEEWDINREENRVELACHREYAEGHKGVRIYLPDAPAQPPEVKT